MNLGTVIGVWGTAAVVSTAAAVGAGYWVVNKLTDAFRDNCTMTEDVLKNAKPGDRIITDQGKCTLG